MTRFRIVFSILVVLSAILIYNVALTSLPYNAIDYSYKTKMHFLTLLPEGWAFFTKNARDENVYVYKKIDGTFENCDPTGSSYKYAFGFNRKGRAKTAELESMCALFSESDWTKDSVLNFAELKSKAQVHDVEDRVKDYAYSGEIFVIKREPIPWAWSRLPGRIDLPFKYIILNVRNTQ